MVNKNKKNIHSNYFLSVTKNNAKPNTVNYLSNNIESDFNKKKVDHIVCIGFTFMKPGTDHLKALANANTAAMYYDLRDNIKGYLALPGNSFDGYDIWLAANNDLYVNNVDTNQFGTPKFRSIIQQVEQSCSPNIFFVGYANADILFDYSLVNTLNILRAWANHTNNSVLIVGRRWNHDLSSRLTVDQVENASSDQFATFAQDYFISTRNFYDWNTIPDYVIGRPAYDNSLVDWAFHKNALMDVSETVKALHQTVADGNSAGHKHNVDKDYNYNLPNIVWDHGTTDHAQFKTMFQDGHIVVIRTSDSTVLWPIENNL